MTVLHDFLRHWEAACDRRGLVKFVAEVPVPEGSQSRAARTGREHLLASALGPWELDDVLSEIALLTLDDDGEETWTLRRLTGPEAARAIGGRLPAHFAKSFLSVTAVRASGSARSSRSRVDRSR